MKVSFLAIRKVLLPELIRTEWDVFSRLTVTWAPPTVTVPFAYIGSGYDNGFNDGRGLGHYRGEYHQEVDRYDVSHPADVVFPDGSVRRPGHREAIFRLVVNGSSGMGHFPIMSGGPHQRYGFSNEP